MNKPLTMRQDQWDDIRDLWDGGHPLQWIVAQGNVRSMFREIDALRAALAAAEAKLADERRHADALKEGLAACVGERATFYAGQSQTVTWAVAIEHAERLLSDHRARRAAEVANG